MKKIHQNIHSILLLVFWQELMDGAVEMDVKSLKNLLIEQDKQTQPVYSWLCNTDYSQYLSKLFKETPRENANDVE